MFDYTGEEVGDTQEKMEEIVNEEKRGKDYTVVQGDLMQLLVKLKMRNI